MTDLAGAGTPAAENESVLSTPQTFAAHWNRHTEEQRAELLTRLRTAAETAARCTAELHDDTLQIAVAQAQLLTTIRAHCSTIARDEDAADAERDLADEIVNLINTDR